MLRVAVLGVGHFGRFHAVKWAANPRATLIGVHDRDADRAALVAGELSVPAESAEALIAAADAVVVSVPTRGHFALAQAALEAGKHVFVEKPIAATVAEAEAMIALAAEQGVVLQVGHIERFSAAFAAVMAAPVGGRALSFEAVRAAPFRPRSLDVSVVLDLMIHDIDLVMALAGEAPLSVAAVGAAVASDRADFCVATLEFSGGRRAVITASRVSLAMERRLRVLGTEGELSVDFLARTYGVLRRGGVEPVATMPGYGVDRGAWVDHDSLEAEQAGFLAAVLGDAPCVVPGEAGLAALRVALAVEASLLGSQK
ncbi:Gfo/Idh/MocA family protein [Plastoroseomonas arctica]|uniref:Gfo/Idh/MocA family oxidoreductase n=1 Tax=Plastoroseomonas arctica TaxID=1509237 RepID=A0AAF1JZP5_9PROT|nr:Gfo/Idh/MocA family oxidoreductase [Plastoroseomonas arctica]MBR0655988.1 Gfo/Idh/MocA family oxidoreductase [Plastoroseomonas arctica]